MTNETLLTRLWEKPILLLEVVGMARSYEEVTRKRRARLGSDAEQHRSMLEQAYEIAMQVVALRERTG